jgi:hypothetical protein
MSSPGGHWSSGPCYICPCWLRSCPFRRLYSFTEVSIVFAALGGWLWLNDGFGAVRTIVAVLIGGGRLIIALAGK